MSPPTGSDEFDEPTQTLRGRAAETIEHVCRTTAKWSAPLIPIVGCVFFAYLIGGYAAISLDVWSPSYEFLSLSEDVYFAGLAFLTGSVICIGTGSLIGLAFLTEGDGRVHNEVSILASFIGFGFGAAVVRMTYVTVFASIL